MFLNTPLTDDRRAKSDRIFFIFKQDTFIL